MYSTPAASHISISDSLMGREALEMSVRTAESSEQNFLNPPPVPDTPTVT